MSFNYKSDEQIMLTIAQSIDEMRRIQALTVEEMAKKGGFNPQTFSNFLNQGSNIKLSTLLQFLRGVGEVDKLQELFEKKKTYSPLGKNKIPPKKIYASRKDTSKNNKKIIWGDDE
jgi:transcriptional regulator with XRE-family HTH domain